MSRKVLVLACLFCLVGLSVANAWPEGTKQPSAGAPQLIGSAPAVLTQWGTDTAQPDTIRYDDLAGGSYLYSPGPFYCSVRFTPLSGFDLRAAYIRILNVLNNTSTFNVWVALDSGGYANPNQIKTMVGPISALSGSPWYDITFVDTLSNNLHFNASQDFHIVYGPFNSPSGYPNVSGLYPLSDNTASGLNRSYLTGGTWPSSIPNSPIGGGCDWRCRAGGRYAAANWHDLSVNNVDNTALRYFHCQNDTVRFRALIGNPGTLAEPIYPVQWHVRDADSTVVFTTSGMYGPLAVGGTAIVTAPLVWNATVLGRYTVTATVTVPGDVVPANDSKMLEQQVDNPALAHLLRYDIPNFQVNLIIGVNGGRIMKFTPCSLPVVITQVQVEVTSGAGNARIRIYGDDGTGAPNPSNILFDSLAALVIGSNSIAVPSIPIVTGSFFVAYQYADATTPYLPMDAEPSAGSNTTMPVMYMTYDAGATWALTTGADHPLRAMVSPMPIGDCELEQQISPNISIGVPVGYYADGTIVPYCVGSNHPPGPNYPVSAVYLAIANNYQDCYLVYINACLGQDEEPIPGHTGLVSRVLQLDFHPGYAVGLAFDRRDNSFWCGDWNTQSLYYFGDVAGPGGSRIIELYGQFPASYFGLPQMPISGLEMDQDGHSLWAVTKGTPVLPDMWLEFDITNPNNPSLIQGPLPIIWQSGGGGGGGAGLEYSDLLNQMVAINQNTNCVEEFQDIGLGIPAPLGACNLSYNGASFGPALMDGPGAIANDSTYTQGHLFTIDIQWSGTGPFSLNEGTPPVPNPSNVDFWHCKELNIGKDGKATSLAKGQYGYWVEVPVKVCSTYATCTYFYFKNAGVIVKNKSSGARSTAPATDKLSYWHLEEKGLKQIFRQGLFAVSYIEIIDGDIECYESAMSYHDHVGAFGSSAEAYPTSLALGNSYNRFQAMQDSLNGVTRFSNHPLSVGPLITRATTGPDTTTEYTVPPGEVISFDAGTVSYPPLAIYSPDFNYLVPPGFPGETAVVDFVVINAGSGAATISLIPSSDLGWQVVSCPANITLGAAEYDTVTVLVEIPLSVEEYDADFFILRAALSSDTVGMGLVIRSIPPLNVTIEAVVGNVVLRWRSSNNPADSLGTQLSYQIYRGSEPFEGFAPVAVTSDTTWIDYGVLPGSDKFFYQVTAGYSE